MTLWFTARELARLFKVPVGTVYRWANEDDWPRTSGRPVYYLHRAAEASATRREPTRARIRARRLTEA